MINHVRTLLLNIGPQQNNGPGAEFIEPTFQAANLPQWMLDVQAVLFPLDASGYQRNLRALMIMQLLHQPDLLPYTLLFDNRYVYSLTDHYFKQTALTGLTITQSGTAGASTLVPVFFADQDPRDLNLKQGLYQWMYTHRISDGNVVTETYNGNKTNRTVTFTNGSTQHITLIPDYLLLYFEDPSDMLSGNFHYTVTLEVPLAFDPVALLSQFERMDLRDATAARVFDNWSAYDTELANLRVIWYQGTEATLRLGAFILAFAIQLERVRQGVSFSDPASSVARVN